MPDRLSYPDPPLSDGVVVLRRWAEGDIGCVEEASRDPYISETTSVPASFTDADGLAWIKRQWRRADNGEGLSLAIGDAGTGEACGVVTLMLRPYDQDTAGIGYWVVERARGRHLASRAVVLAARWALADARVARVEALVEPDNAASQRVMDKAGFQQEGHLRSCLAMAERRADALIYSLIPADLSS